MSKIYKINGNPAGFEDLDVFHKLAQQFLPYAHKKLGFDKPVGVNLLSDPENIKDPLGKTAYYDPNKMEITLFVDKRHVKDILRSMAHELVHHTQNCRGEFDGGINTEAGYAQEDGHMRKMEAEAYLKGSGFLLRDWEDSLKSKKENKIMKETKDHKGSCKKAHQGFTHEEWKKEQVNEELSSKLDEENYEEELEERTKRDTPDRVSGRDTSGRRLKPLEEQEEEEETAGETVKKAVKDLPGKLQKVVPQKVQENENWTRGNKDKLLFERLKEKWCK